MIASRAARKPEPKLRASCDGCYHAKLKCSKERPACPRCRNLGLVCHYSPSQRMGKPRQNHNRTQQTHVKTDLQPGLSAASSPRPWPTPLSMSSQPMSPNPTTSTTDLPMVENFPMSPDRPNTMNSSPAPFDDDILNWQQDDSLFQLTDTFLSPFPNTFPHVDHQYLAAHDPVFARSTDSKSCDCYESTARSLHYMQTGATDAEFKSLDVILNDSKEVVQRGEDMLNCTCSEDSALIMLFAGLIAKHFSFFHQKTAPSPSSSVSSSSLTFSPIMMTPPASRSASHSSDSSSGTDMTANGQATPFTYSRITIGKYTMDGKDEERLRTEIILMELSKVNALLAKFRAKFARLPAGYERQTYDTLMDFLDQKFQDATRGLEQQRQVLK